MRPRTSLSLEPLEPRVLLSAAFAEQQLITDLVDLVYSVDAADLNGDGYVDVLSASVQDGTVAWYQNLGGGQFGPQRVITRDAGLFPSVCAADLDGDGDTDVLSASARFRGGTYRGRVTWYENLGAGIFGAAQVVRTGDGMSLSSVFAPDVDGDGDADVLSLAGGKVAWNENLGAGFLGPMQVIAGSGDGVVDFCPYDLDGDGDVDVIWTALQVRNWDYSMVVQWRENSGDGSFGQTHLIRESSDLVGSFRAADLDGDGDADALMGSLTSDSIAWYENLGSEGFGPGRLIDRSRPAALQAADVDGDGDADLLASCYYPDLGVVWYENLGDGEFGSRQVIGQKVASALCTVDLDADGDPDLLSGQGRQVVWFQNLAVGAVATLTGAVEDQDFTVPHASFVGALEEANAGGGADWFRVLSVRGGTLAKDGSPVVPGTTLFGPGESLTWRPSADANGTLPAFTVRGWDGQAAVGEAVSVNVVVTPANDAPTLASVSTLKGAIENTEFAVPYAALSGAADAADVDGDALSFRIESVAAGCTLTRGDGSPVVPGTLLGAGESLVWCPPADQCGPLDAFTVTAWDGAASSSTPVQVRVSVQPAAPYVGTIPGTGTAKVFVYDMDGGGDVDLADINVVFADGDTVDHIDLNGDGTMGGLGLVVTGADTAGAVNDNRTTPGNVAFLASTGQFAGIYLNGDVSGWDLNGLTLQDEVGTDVVAFADDIDGDGTTDDLVSVYVGDYVQGNVKVQGTMAGDIWIAGSNAYNWSLKVLHVYGAALAGDLRAPGKVGVVKTYGDYSHVVDVGPELRYFLLYGGDFSGQVTTSGPMYAFLVDGNITGSAQVNVGGVVQRGNRTQSWGKAGEAIHYFILRNGMYCAGANVRALNGRIFRANLPDHERDNDGLGFGFMAESYGYVLLGDTYVTPFYTDGDFVLMQA